jgi:SAM-dependent MidA family methyltransferase
MLTVTSEAELSLSERLRARIKRDGPISFHDWMQAALYDEREGYYCRRDIDRWGRLGDYRTAPERTPLFAATLARYFVKLFEHLGSPSSWTIVEVGAGFGEFALGVLNFLESNHPQIFASTGYLIDEESVDGRERVAANLARFESRFRFCRLNEITETIPFGILFSNELIDAFPVHRVILRGDELRSLYVGVNDKDDFIWIEGQLDSRVAEYCNRIGLQLIEGQIAEINLAAEEFIARAATLFQRGFVITIDYGAERDELIGSPYRRQGTLRAAFHHQLANNVLQQPGLRDLTTTIDWTQLKETGRREGLTEVRFERLDQFLLQEGLLKELENRTQAAGDAENLSLRTGAREMIMPDGMAASFQVLVQERFG